MLYEFNDLIINKINNKLDSNEDENQNWIIILVCKFFSDESTDAGR